MSYLHATRHFELVYSRDCSKQYDAVLEIFAWADNAFMCYIDSKSQNGYCLSLGNHDTAKFMWYRQWEIEMSSVVNMRRRDGFSCGGHEGSYMGS